MLLEQRKTFLLLVSTYTLNFNKCTYISKGTSKTPRSFVRLAENWQQRLPITYKSNDSAWMVQDIWTSWLTAWDEELVSKNEKILLLVDNCSAHTPPPNFTLRNITIEFLPKNTTSYLQPLDAGIIHSLKAAYRVELVNRWLKEFDEKKEITMPTIAEAVIMLVNSWRSLDVKTIKNCWAHTKILTEHQRKYLQREEENYETNSSFDELTESLTKLKIAMEPETEVKSSMNTEEYVKFDDLLHTFEESFEEVIVDEVKKNLKKHCN